MEQSNFVSYARYARVASGELRQDFVVRLLLELKLL